MQGRPESASTGSRPTRVRAAALLAPTFKRAFWHVYDHLGTLIGANLLWLVLCAGVVTAPAATAGLFHLARRIAADEDARIRDFWAGFRHDFLPSLAVGAFTAGLAALLWFNIYFYGALGGGFAFVGAALATLLVWAAVLLVLMHVHIHPLLASGDRSLASIFRKSLLLTLDNPAFTVSVSLTALGLTALCVVSAAGLVLISGSLAAVLLSTAHRELMKKYLPDSPEAAEPDETRTWRDLWRPWESQKPR